MTRSFSRWIDRLQRNWLPANRTRPRRSRGDVFWCVAEVAEYLESRRLLSSSGSIIIGADTPYNWNGPGSVTGPQVNGISEAMSSDGSKVVMVVADATPTNQAATVCRVLEFTNNGTALSLVRNFVLETNSNGLGGSGSGEPLVGMKGDGSEYVVTWRGSDGWIRAAAIDFNGATVVSPMDLVAPVNTNGTATYTITPSAYSMAMRSDGTFVLAWNSSYYDSSTHASGSQAQAQVFNINLTTASSMVQALNTGGDSWNPAVAWSNHGNNATWDVAWTGQRTSTFGGNPPMFHMGNGDWLQQYTGSTFDAEVQVVPMTQSGQYEPYSQFSLTSDPVGNVGMITNSVPYGPSHIWVYNSSLQPYSGLPSPMTSYNPPDSQTQAFPAIAFDASGTNGAFQHILVGSQRYAEGPGANWGYFTLSTQTWSSGYLNANAGSPNDIEDMFVDGVINSQGTWWVFGRQYDVSNPHATGWMYRAFDPPAAPAGAAFSMSTADGLDGMLNLAAMQSLFSAPAADGAVWGAAADGAHTDGKHADGLRPARR